MEAEKIKLAKEAEEARLAMEAEKAKLAKEALKARLRKEAEEKRLRAERSFESKHGGPSLSFLIADRAAHRRAGSPSSRSYGSRSPSGSRSPESRAGSRGDTRGERRSRLPPQLAEKRTSGSPPRNEPPLAQESPERAGDVEYLDLSSEGGAFTALTQRSAAPRPSMARKAPVVGSLVSDAQEGTRLAIEASLRLAAKRMDDAREAAHAATHRAEQARRTWEGKAAVVDALQSASAGRVRAGAGERARAGAELAAKHAAGRLVAKQVAALERQIAGAQAARAALGLAPEAAAAAASSSSGASSGAGSSLAAARTKLEPLKRVQAQLAEQAERLELGLKALDAREEAVECAEAEALRAAEAELGRALEQHREAGAAAASSARAEAEAAGRAKAAEDAAIEREVELALAELSTELGTAVTLESPAEQQGVEPAADAVVPLLSAGAEAAPAGSKFSRNLYGHVDEARSLAGHDDDDDVSVGSSLPSLPTFAGGTRRDWESVAGDNFSLGDLLVEDMSLGEGLGAPETTTPPTRLSSADATAGLDRALNLEPKMPAAGPAAGAVEVKPRGLAASVGPRAEPPRPRSSGQAAARPNRRASPRPASSGPGQIKGTFQAAGGAVVNGSGGWANRGADRAQSAPATARQGVPLRPNQAAEARSPAASTRAAATAAVEVQKERPPSPGWRSRARRQPTRRSQSPEWVRAERYFQATHGGQSLSILVADRAAARQA
eukprot:CAMPEP_0172597012 /NCGR_PEP_ID=MMETSP1068-20121228/16917_1 /TAXON_ID=35684 /ORGANISM="Pseudopedinella elastica, Strain CCMP716" /LENGTH=725 /DNA_ID=CAMNT_0013396307 /DNA_START=13 /DNA_END=2186 /DNA_ORIENTATION=-